MTVTQADLPSFGTLLRAFRTRRRFTQQQLAEVLGMHRHAVSRWERGDFLPASKTVVLELARHLRLSDLETRQFLEASLVALAPHWLVPLPRNHFFTGREEILHALHTHFDGSRSGAPMRSCALQGLGGVGKTQIALEYAYRHALEYSAIFWIGAETDEQIVSSLLRIAEVLQLPEREDHDQQRAVAAVQRWLNAHHDWLLIWDNVEDLALLNRYLPSARAGANLITTRSHSLGTLARSIDLLPMECAEGMLFLLQRAKIIEPEAGIQHVKQLALSQPEKYAAAKELVEVVDGLPLALDQAGAYIEETACGLSAYLDLFRTQRASLLQQRGEGSCVHPESVSATFTLAITATTSRHPAVRDLLQICALLQPDAIPEDLFHRGAEYFGQILEAVCRDDLEWNRVLAIACSYSLLHRHPEERTLSLHRMVQAVLQDGMDEQTAAAWLKRATAALNVVFPEVSYGVWEECERLLPHVLTCIGAIRDCAADHLVVELIRKAADYLRARAQYSMAEPLYQRAVALGEQVLGAEDPVLAFSLNNLANLYYDQGKYSQAAPLYQRTLHIGEQALGPDHPLLVYPLVNLAAFHLEYADYPRAESLFRRALHIREETLGPEHPDLADPLGGLADLYYEQGRYGLAEQLHQRALHIRELALGADHAMLIFPLTNLANVYSKQGKGEQAESLYQRALQLGEQTWGAEHPYTTWPLLGLANLYRQQRQETLAESLYQRVWQIREQQLGPHHPETAQILYDLALFRQEKGDIGEAPYLAERALHIRSQTLGDTHPKTVATRKLYTKLEQARAEESQGHQEDGANKRGQDRESKSEDIAPVSMQAMTASTASQNNQLEAFLVARCELHPLAWCRIRDLRYTYEQWIAAYQRCVPLSRRAFAAQLQARGCCIDRTSKMRIWRGIRLVTTSR
ncbi:MAG: tetratricopeptide repeat protein [Ktedonobacterales bacterium]